MPCLQSISHSSNQIVVVGNDGLTFTLTKAQIIAHFQTETGTVQQRVLATIAWAAAQIAVGIGLDPASVIIGFDGSNLVSLGISS